MGDMWGEGLCCSGKAEGHLDLLRRASSGSLSAPHVPETLPTTRKTSAELRVVKEGRGGILEKALTQHFHPGVGQLIQKVIQKSSCHQGVGRPALRIFLSTLIS